MDRIKISEILPKLDNYFDRTKADIIDRYYCRGTNAFDWVSSKPVKTRIKKDYEELIKNYIIEGMIKPQNKNDLLVIVGGIGTGKSTAITKVIKNIVNSPRNCKIEDSGIKTCGQKPIVLKFDFIDFSDEEPSDEKRILELENNFWNFILSDIKPKLLDDYEDSAEKLVMYWRWLLKNSDFMKRAISISKILSAHQHIIERIFKMKEIQENDAQIVTRIQVDIYEKSSVNELVWYNIFKFVLYKHILKSNCPCILVVLDNIDHASLKIQRIALRFSILITNILKSSSVIVIRPLTLKRSLHGHYLITKELHYSPSLSRVIEKRVQAFIEDNQSSGSGLKIHAKLMTNILSIFKMPLFEELLSSTAGLSIRYAIRNFMNMLESPLLEDRDAKDIKNMRISEIARAYFFSSQDAIDLTHFENLYSIDNDMSPEYGLIKPRILDYLCREQNGEYRINELIAFMKDFGHKEYIIMKALNEMLIKTRPLLWSESGHTIDGPESNDRIMVAPIGYGYYYTLFGEYFYDEICAAKSTKDTVYPQTIYNNHHALFDQDLEEVEHFVTEVGTENYKRIYSSNFLSISFMHWQKLLAGFEQRVKHNNNVYDPKRINKIEESVNDILFSN